MPKWAFIMPKWAFITLKFWRLTFMKWTPGLHLDKLLFCSISKITSARLQSLETFESKSECATNELLLLPNFF